MSRTSIPKASEGAQAGKNATRAESERFGEKDTDSLPGLSLDRSLPKDGGRKREKKREKRTAKASKRKRGGGGASASSSCKGVSFWQQKQSYRRRRVGGMLGKGAREVGHFSNEGFPKRKGKSSATRGKKKVGIQGKDPTVLCLLSQFGAREQSWLR